MCSSDLFVDSTPRDRFVARVTFDWTAASASGPGTVRLDRANIPITTRIGTDQFLRGGESRRMPPGSYNVVVSAPGFLPTRLTVELLPGVTTQVAVSLLPEAAGLLYVAARPWASVFIDGEPIGYTSVAAHRVVPGRHVVRLEYQDGAAKDTAIVVDERQAVRLSWIGQPDTTGDPQLDRALVALDGADTERGAVLLRQWLSADAGGAPEGTRSLALARLAEIAWSLGLSDSARAYLRDLVRVNPFHTPPADLFNPELRALYRRVRGETPAIGIRGPRDTVMSPLRDTLPLEIAVGRPGKVLLLLRLTTPRPHDSLLTALSVDSVATAKIPLTGRDGTVWVPGSFAIEADAVGPDGSASDLLQLNVERMSVDTMPHKPSLPEAEYRPETKRTAPSRRTIAEGVGLGALVLVVSAGVNDPGVSGRSIPVGAWLIGASVALGNIAFKRPSVVIPESVRYNQALRAQWEAQNRLIAADNATRLRTAPLRLRVTGEP